MAGLLWLARRLPARFELVEIGADCFIGHGVMFTNDLFAKGGPARGDRSLWKSTHIGDRVSIGSNATLLPVKICNDVVIGAGAVVTHDVPAWSVVAGNPARVVRRLDPCAVRGPSSETR